MDQDHDHGRAPPHIAVNEERLGGQTEAFGGQRKEVGDGNSTAQPQVDKAFATLRARAALAGHALDRRVDGRGLAVYAASRWGWSRPFADLALVERWVDVRTGEVTA